MESRYRWPEAAKCCSGPRRSKRRVMADLYKVTSPDDPVLQNGNKLCKGKPVAYLIVWKSEKVVTRPIRVLWHLSPGRNSTLARPTTAGATLTTRLRIEIKRLSGSR